jgi:uncharacterized protein YyaL (SSP411 family)
MANRLADETSAYLRQHAENPVDWYAWGPEAWERARREDRPVLVSIGYSSCHWCHVMERESFEDSDVAALMNEKLVSIKVDREERPDVDQIYMDTVVRMTGSGGWPLNMFCTPDGRPFFGGTYFPPTPAYGRSSWSETVTAVAKAYAEQRSDVDAQAARVLEALRTRPDLPPAGPPGTEELSAFVRELMQRADSSYGGFGAAPKFPTPTNLEALLYANSQSVAVAGALDHVMLTLKRMARGGIYDQLGGGFHRYSTDARWLVPHFEKMLYDQGQLLRVYAETARQTGDSELLWPVAETIEFLEREMRDAAGGFYASQDADSEGEEGRFYVWDAADIEAVLGAEEAQTFCEAYAVVPGGSFEQTGKSVLEHVLAGERPRFAESRARLFEARTKRVAPDTDRKQVTAWIAYTAGGLATCAAAFERDEWLQAAQRAADFLLGEMRDSDGGLLRIHDGERARVPAFLDDHAAVLCALLDLHRAGAPDRYAAAALEIAESICTRFFDAERADLFFAPEGDSTLVFRPASDSDGATPAANGLAVLGLVRAGELSGRTALLDVARSVLATHGPFARRLPQAAPTLLRAAALLERGLGVALVRGEPADPRSRALAARARHLLTSEDAVVIVPPGAAPEWLSPEWLEGRDATDGAPTAYVCRGQVCSLPARTPEEIALPPGA